MEQQLEEYPVFDTDTTIQFLSDREQDELKKADANPFIKISLADRRIPFIVLSDGGVVADVTANNPKTILDKTDIQVRHEGLGAGIIDVFHGNRTLKFHRIESSIFKRKWRVDDIVSALQQELNLYYPGYRIQSR